jgi:hypothetical protein
MEDRGSPISYLALAEGTPVLASDGTPVGTVAHVLADEGADIFDGLVIDAGGHRFADAALVREIYERAVVLGVDADGARALPEPSGNPPVLSADPADSDEPDIQRKLRRAWDWISGRY